MPHAEPPRRGLPLRLTIVLLTLSLFGCDHATKRAAEAALSRGRDVSIVSGVLDLHYAMNFDTAFSLLRSLGIERHPSVLLAASGLALVGVLGAWWVARRRATRAQHVGFALVVAGALGNVVDRATRGYVIDFIHLTHWPVFNVADMSVVVGTFLLLVAALRNRSAPPPSVLAGRG